MIDLTALPIFPCNLAKEPLTAHGFKDAKPQRGWKGWPLVGFPTGAKSGFDVLDIDPRGREWFDQNYDALPTTLAHSTHRGLHLVFKHAVIWRGQSRRTRHRRQDARTSKPTGGDQVMNATETQSGIQRAIGDLTTLREQWAGVESIDAERKKAEAKLAGVKANVAAMRAEFNEVKAAHDKLLAQAYEKQAECQRLDKEIKTKSKKLSEVKAALSALPDLGRRLERFDAEFKGKAAELSNVNAALINTLRQQQGG